MADDDDDNDNALTLNETGARPLGNPRHERFALLVAAAEVSAVEAYRREIRKGGNETTVKVAAFKLSHSPAVAGRIAWLKAEGARRAAAVAEGVVLSIVEKRLFLARVVRTPLADVTPQSDLCQEWSLVESERARSERIRMPSKLDAIKLDNELAPANDGRGFEIIIRKL